MKAFGMATCGSNMEVRFLPNGDPVGEVSLAFRLGKKDKATGEYLTQWVKATLFGKRAESLSPYIVKGSKHAFVLRDIRVDEYSKDGDKRFALRADIDDIELGSKQAEPEARQAPASRAPARTAPAGNGFDSMADDVPF